MAKTNDELTRELTAAGYDPALVQAAVGTLNGQQAAQTNAATNTNTQVTIPSTGTPARSYGTNYAYGQMPTYLSRYQDQIDAVSNQLLNRPAFSYTAAEDPLYQQYEKYYQRNGRKAMEDTLGQVSARTGGLASSYAGSAAQQRYDDYMWQLASKVPELQQLAYSMYQDEGNNLRNNLNTLQGLEATDYARFQDEYNSWLRAYEQQQALLAAAAGGSGRGGYGYDPYDDDNGTSLTDIREVVSQMKKAGKTNQAVLTMLNTARNMGQITNDQFEFFAQRYKVTDRSQKEDTVSKNPSANKRRSFK